MSTAGLIESVHKAGGRMHVEGAELKLSARAPLPDELLSHLKAHKTELLAELQADNAAQLSRCREACEGLPVSPADLLASVNEEDRTAMLSGDPDELAALRTMAGILAKRLELARLDRRIEAAYRWCREELAKHPGYRRSIYTIDPDADPVLIAVAVRGIGCATLKIKRENYAGREFELLELVHRVDTKQAQP